MQGTSDFRKSLPWLALKPVAKYYQIIVISFYRNIAILGVKIARVTRALGTQNWIRRQKRRKTSSENITQNIVKPYFRYLEPIFWPDP